MFSSTLQILIVDDMLSMRRIVAKHLRDLGYKNIHESADGLEAWDILNEAKPPIELIISDWNMPHCTGINLLRRVRSSIRYTTLPFIMLTAEGESHQIHDALNLNVSSYLIKPFSGEMLKKALEIAYAKIAA